VQLTGLTPGQRYDFRLYHREWAASGDRTQDFLFDGDGDFAFEDMANINEDDATDMPPGFATEDQAYFLSYVYTAGASGNLNLQINTETGEGTYHLYGLTNELTNELIVPEPGSIAIWALLGTLGAGVAYRRSRRRANRR
jgi:hypothetical protein